MDYGEKYRRYFSLNLFERNIIDIYRNYLTNAPSNNNKYIVILYIIMGRITVDTSKAAMRRLSLSKKTTLKDVQQDSRIRTLESKMGRVVNSQKNNVDTTVIQGLIPTVGGGTVGQPLFLCAQGDTPNSRGGNIINGVKVMGTISLAKVASNNTSTRVRVLIVRYNAVLGSAGASSDFMKSTEPLNFPAWDTLKTYQIVYDRYVLLGRLDGGADTKVLKYNFKIPKSKSQVSYSGSTAAASATLQNHLVAFIYGSDVSTSDIEAYWFNRFVFNP